MKEKKENVLNFVKVYLLGNGHLEEKEAYRGPTPRRISGNSLCGCEMEGSSLGSDPVAHFCVNRVKTSGSVLRELVTSEISTQTHSVV
jgi:hypothetical protein